MERDIISADNISLIIRVNKYKYGAMHQTLPVNLLSDVRCTAANNKSHQLKDL